MHLPLSVHVRKTEEGFFLTVFRNGESDQVGPLDLDNINVGDEHVHELLLTLPEEQIANQPSQRLRKRSRREERKIAKDVGGRAQPNSGAMPHAKGDVRKRGELRIESKLTGSKQFVVTRALLDKIRGECGMGEKPAFIITFIHKSTLREEDRWVLIPYEDWHAANVDR